MLPPIHGLSNELTCRNAISNCSRHFKPPPTIFCATGRRCPRHPALEQDSRTPETPVIHAAVVPTHTRMRHTMTGHHRSRPGTGVKTVPLARIGQFLRSPPRSDCIPPIVGDQFYGELRTPPLVLGPLRQRFRFFAPQIALLPTRSPHEHLGHLPGHRRQGATRIQVAVATRNSLGRQGCL